jgi:electron transfer flavoprotein alpha subunit
VSRVLVFCETDGDSVRKGSRQAIGAARRLGAQKVEVLLIGKDGESVVPKLGALGVSRAIVVPYEGDYSTAVWTAAAAQAVGDGDCLFLASNTAIARDFTPRLGGKLGCPQVTDITELSGSPGSVQIRRPIYAGKAFEDIKSESKVLILTLRPNAFAEEAEVSGGAAPEVTQQSAPEVPANLQTKVREVLKSEKDEIDLTEADVIVSGGIGVGGPEGFDALKPLCKELGAALGASRAAVLAGWISPDHQVGQTGKTVSPQLYIAMGISGAIQHRAGMSSSKCIVAVNKDEQAPIFEIADYGIVADLFQVLPPFLEAVKKIKAG